MAMRITPHSQTKFLPFRLMYSREATDPAELSFNYKEQFITMIIMISMLMIYQVNYLKYLNKHIQII
jgi:hypothetical protein